ncbi:hypothetical protein AB0D49_26740 [Streptomyces sp. NPDC048290]|uniref:hypothetical protein n=1 Tax=Streptomyces sp. NPDC048290 TaxID=3155811 RepID=UPI00341C96C3
MPDNNTFEASTYGMKQGTRITDQIASLADKILTAYSKSEQFPRNPTFGDADDDTVIATLEKYVPFRNSIAEGLEGTVGAILKSGDLTYSAANNFEDQQDQNTSDIVNSSRPRP